MKRYKIIIKGTVQGVGFRPFVYQLAKAYQIKGTVHNSSQGVIIEAEGKGNSIQRFLNELKKHPSVLSRIKNYQQIELQPIGYTSFQISDTHGDEEKEALVPPDIATCKACKHDIFNPQDNHYQYPFTNCTNCGPRFTIIREVPYDRQKTSMASFEMCNRCNKEYYNPSDRRFHAQPVACLACGPHVWITDSTGNKIAENENWLEVVWRILQDGKILALKGIGGFHLVCDANHSKILFCE